MKFCVLLSLMLRQVLRIAFFGSLLATSAAALWLGVRLTAALRDLTGPNRLVIALQCEHEGNAQLFYDIGNGVREEDSATIHVFSSVRIAPAAFELPRRPLTQLRFDPPPNVGKFQIGSARLESASGRVIAELPLASIKALHQVGELRVAGDRLEASATPAAEDPQLSFTLNTPLGPGGVRLPYGALTVFGAATLIAFMLSRSSEAQCGWRSAKDHWAAFREVLLREGPQTLALGAAVVGLGELNWLWPLHRALDLPLWDEVNYAAHGADWIQRGGSLGEMHSSPLFVAAYGVWSVLLDVGRAIFAQHYFVKLTSTVLLYVVLARWWRSWIAAAAVALAWGATQFQLEFPLLVYQFAFVWFLAGLATIDRWPIAGLGFVVLASCARQEYQFALGAAVAGLGWRAWQQRRSSFNWLANPPARRNRLVATAVSATVVLLAAGIVARTQFGHSDARAWFAFQQHYAVRAVNAGEAAGLNPWLDYPQLIQRDFSGADSLHRAWSANRSAFLHHVGYNLRELPAELFNLMVAHAGLRLAMVALSVMALAALLRPRPLDRTDDINVSVALALGGLIAIMPGLLVLAKGAYLLAILPVTFGLVGALVPKLSLALRLAPSNGRVLGGVAMTAVIVIATGPRVFDPAQRPRPVTATIAGLREIWPTTGKHVLLGTSASSYAHYLGDARCTGLEPFSEATGTSNASAPFARLLESTQPFAVLVTSEWQQSSRFPRAEIERLLTAPQWQQRDLPGGTVYFRR